MSDEYLTMASDAQFASLWLAALDQYAETNEKRRLDDLNIPKLHTVDNLMTEIDNRHTQFSEFRSSRQRLFDALGMALKPIELISNIAAGVGNQVRPFYTIINSHFINYTTGISSKLLHLWLSHVFDRCQ